MVWKILGITPGDPKYDPRRENLCFLGLGDCGSHESTTVNTSISNDVNLQATVSTTLNKANSTTVSSTVIDNLEINYGVMSECCPGCSSAVQEAYIQALADQAMCGQGSINVNQTGNQSVNVYSQLKSQDFVDMSTKLQSQVSTMIDNDVKQLSQEDINVISNILSENNKKTDISNNIKNSVNEAIKQSFTENLVNSVITNTVNTQEGSFNFCYPIAENGCSFNQDQTQSIQVTNILNSLSSVVQSADAISKISEAVKSGVFQEDEGIIGGLTGFLKKLGPIVIAAIAGGVLLIIVLVIVLIMTRRKHDNSTVVLAPGASTQPTTQ